MPQESPGAEPFCLTVLAKQGKGGKSFWDECALGSEAPPCTAGDVGGKMGGLGMVCSHCFAERV